MWSRVTGAVSILVAVQRIGFGSAFVTPAPRSSALSGLSSPLTRSQLPVAQGCRSPYGSVQRRWKAAVTGMRTLEEEGLGERDDELEQEGGGGAMQTVGGASAPSPSVVAASGMVAGAAVVSLAALGGFPETAMAAAPGWVGPVKLVLDPILLYFEFAFVARIVLSWYPALDLNSAPQNLVAWPTEPILKPTRAVVPPAFGVDISPIVWVMICSFLREILLGQQGILNLISNK